jgi:hypothetical protein
MASGNDFRFAIAKESTYATFTRNRAFSAALGQGRWERPSVLTTRGGSGTLSGEVPTAGFGYLLDALHGNTVTPVQIAYDGVHADAHARHGPGRSRTRLQKQVPPVLTNTLVPLDYTGVMFTGMTISWSAGGLLTWSACR